MQVLQTQQRRSIMPQNSPNEFNFGGIDAGNEVQTANDFEGLAQ
jgi:hypothetical protein